MHLIRPLAKVIPAAALAVLLPIIGASAASAATAGHPHECGEHRLAITEAKDLSVATSTPILCAGLTDVKILSAVPVTNNGGPIVQIWKLNRGVTQAQFRSHLAVDISAPGDKPDPAAAKAAKWVEQHVRTFNGTQTSGRSFFQIVLQPGRYYVADIQRFLQTGQATTLSVIGFVHRHAYLPYVGQSLRMVNTPAGSRFAVNGYGKKLHDGWLRIENDAYPEIHFAELLQVKPGTTNQDLTNFFNGKGDPTIKNGANEGTGVISPGVAVNWWLHLPTGTYAVLCFITDDETGMAHVFMGMHTVVRVVND